MYFTEIQTFVKTPYGERTCLFKQPISSIAVIDSDTIVLGSILNILSNYLDFWSITTGMVSKTLKFTANMHEHYPVTFVEMIDKNTMVSVEDGNYLKPDKPGAGTTPTTTAIDRFSRL